MPKMSPRPQTDGFKLKTDTVLNDEASDIERDMCSCVSIGGGGVTQILKFDLSIA